MILMKRWFKYVKENIIYIALFLLIVFSVLGGVQGCVNRSALTDASAERAEYIKESRELMERLQESQDLVRESLRQLGEIRQLHNELREQIEGIGEITQSVGDDSIGIGIESDENLRIIRELTKRIRASETE